MIKKNMLPFGNVDVNNIMEIKLSVLVCTIPEREQLVNNLKRIVSYQSDNSVEMIVCMDNKKASIGKKRNDLLNAAKGEYICYLDDDDMISPYYVSRVLDSIKEGPDCVGIKGIIVGNRIEPRVFIHSLEYSEWFEKNGVYYRCPNHLNPIKREIALKVGFPDKSFGEDRDYSYGIKQFLTSEVMIDEPIYYYYPSKGL